MSDNITNVPSSDVAKSNPEKTPSSTSSDQPSSGAGEFTEEQAAGVLFPEPVVEKPLKPAIKQGKNVVFSIPSDVHVVQEGEYDDKGQVPFSETSSTVSSETKPAEKPVLPALRPIAPLKVGDTGKSGIEPNPEKEEEVEYADDEYDLGYRPMGGNYARDKKEAKKSDSDNPTRKNISSEAKTKHPGKVPLAKGHVRERYYIGEEVDYSVFKIEASAGALPNGPVPVDARPLQPAVSELVGQVDYDSYPLIARVEVEGGRIPVVQRGLNDLFIDKRLRPSAPVVSGVQYVTNFKI